MIVLGKRFVTLNELGEKLGVKPNTLYVWARAGRLKYRKEGHKILVEDVPREKLLRKKICKDCGRVFYTVYPRQEFHNSKCAGPGRKRRFIQP